MPPVLDSRRQAWLIGMKGAGFDFQFFEWVVYCVDADKVGIEIEYENIDVYNILCVFFNCSFLFNCKDIPVTGV